MAKRWIISPVLGSGKKGDPYRSKLRDLGIDHVATIPSDQNGAPVNAWCVCLVQASDFAKIDADAEFSTIPDTTKAVDPVTEGDAKAALTKVGADSTAITPASTGMDVLRCASAKLAPGWDSAGTDLA